jgi:uncharacterized cupredoxin-like copper-binding protein
VKRFLVHAAAAALIGSTALAVTACAPQHQVATGAVVRVSEGDFHIKAPRQVTAGDVTLLVHNRGPDAHELIVVRTKTGSLPLRHDGLTVDEDAVEHDEAGALEPGAPGATRELHVRLTPGRYVLLCNMSGHYLGGMRMSLVVR